VVSWRNPDARHRAWNMDTYGQAIWMRWTRRGGSPRPMRSSRWGSARAGILLSMTLARWRTGARPTGSPGSPSGSVYWTRAGRGTASAFDRRADRRPGQVRLVGARLPGRAGAGGGVRLAAPGRPGVELLGQHLPAGPPNPRRSTSCTGTPTPPGWPPGCTTRFVDMGLVNALATPGGITMLGAPVDLGEVKTDGYVLAGVADHISPWQSCYRGARLLGGDVTFVLSSSGHIASIVNPPTNPKASYRVARTSGTRSSGRPKRQRRRGHGGQIFWRGWASGPAGQAGTVSSGGAGVQRRDGRPRRLHPGTLRSVDQTGEPSTHGLHWWCGKGTRPGRRLLLMNGIGAQLEALQPFVDALDPAITVIRFDAPGVGHSLPKKRPYRSPPWPAASVGCSTSWASEGGPCWASPGAAGWRSSSRSPSSAGVGGWSWWPPRPGR